MRKINAEILIPIFVMVGILASAFLFAIGVPRIPNLILGITLFFGALPFIRDMLGSIAKFDLGIDLIAAVGILSSLLIGEYLAGCIILLMLSGGKALEFFALRRARKELSSLLSHAPTQAHRKHKNTIEDLLASDVRVGDVLVIKPGETVPVDGIVMQGKSIVDESALTGESMPVEKSIAAHLMSGSLNIDGVLEVRVLRSSKESKYEQIVRLVREAENKKAPFVRMADRYSVWFTVIAFSLAGLAWLLSHDPVRALAVLVVATPCPLILAAPIAFASGISRAAKRGIIIKYGEAMEKLAEAKSILFDKTGTLTLGVPKVLAIKAWQGTEENTLRLAASLDQLSAHILAKSLVTHAQARQVSLLFPEDFKEAIGSGVTGKIEKQCYYFGKLDYLEAQGIYLSPQLQAEHAKLRAQGQIAVYLADAKHVMGAIYFADQIRTGIRAQFYTLKRMVEHLVMVTGDKQGVALAIASEIGIGEIKAECLPEDKLAEVKRLQRAAGPVVMVGDGINDAPALAAADVGIALGSGSSTAAHEAGDVVIAIDNFDRVVEVFQISRRVIYIAKQCIFVGIGLSVFLMLIAALGYVTPVIGALLQELIDVIVILNALRVHVKKD